MAWCQDKAITYLNKYGYNVLKLPRSGSEPLDVLGDDRRVEKLGTVADLWGANVDLPKPGVPQATTPLSGIESDELDLKLGLRLLTTLLAGLGVTGLNDIKLEAGYRGTKKLVFKIINPVSVAVSPFELGSYIQGRVLDWSHPLVSTYFMNDDADAYVITEVLKAQGVALLAKGARETGIDISLPVIEAAVGGQIAVKPVGESISELQYSGSTPITFGFKCFAIQYADGAWQMHGIKPSGDLSFGLGEETAPAVMLRPGRLVRLES